MRGSVRVVDDCVVDSGGGGCVGEAAAGGGLSCVVGVGEAAAGGSICGEGVDTSGEAVGVAELAAGRLDGVDDGGGDSTCC